MTVTIRYFARLRDEAGRNSEVVETSCSTVGDLWNNRVSGLGLLMAQSLVKPACNDEFCSWDTLLTPGAVIAFLPPVAGG
ncbi:MAG: MoaD/ThiS family protein [Spirochaetales bacterium]|nr:MoaD/ThiS family protein [Spirochaetales bacterium]